MKTEQCGSLVESSLTQAQALRESLNQQLQWARRVGLDQIDRIGGGSSQALIGT